MGNMFDYLVKTDKLVISEVATAKAKQTGAMAPAGAIQPIEGAIGYNGQSSQSYGSPKIA